MKIKKKYNIDLNISNITNKILVFIFDRKYLQGFIEKILTKFLRVKSVSRFFEKWKFAEKNFKDAEIIELGENYLKFKNVNTYQVTIKNETRNVSIINSNSQIEGSIFLNKTSIFRFGINTIFSKTDLKKNKNENINVKLIFELKKNKIKIIKNFSFPIGESKHAIFGGGQIKNWLDFSQIIQIKEPQEVSLSLSLFTTDPFLMFSENTNTKNKIYNSNHKLALSAPFVASIDEVKKKIILISIESMTDPEWLKDNFNIQFNLPSFENLINDSEHFSCAVPQVDCTRPFAHSILYGLLPSQHKQGSYKYDLDSSKNRTIAESLKDKKFYTTAGLPYLNHFDPDFGLSKGFDTYFCTKRPEQNDAPDISWILRSLNSQKENNHFIFSHIQRLHPPFISLDNSQYPNSLNLVSLDMASKRNWIDIYIDQLYQIDQQINHLTSSLKSQNLYENTMIVLLGDHGVGIPPQWKKTNNEFAHFEMRGRVPFLIKHANWSPIKNKNKNKLPTNATLTAYDKILSALEIVQPKKVLKSREYISYLEGYAIMETIFHPKEDNYSISIRSNDYKVWVEFLVNWKLRKIIKQSNKKKFKIINNNLEEDISFNKNFDNNDELKKMYNLLNNFVEKNFCHQFYE
ncbi:sulfatase-like hydrolase/transferase [Candidatus Pelagibacter sp.]|nr:sulfatase-like hydrolase/transferase [Candidatus Pelagibacter sp.]